jgi:four helix bundle protein
MSSSTQPASSGSQRHRKGENLNQRLAGLAAAVIDLVDEWPDGVGNHTLRDQLVRAAMAPGAHYAEARSAQSRDDFIHKAALAAKESRETLHWLRVVEQTNTIGGDVTEIIKEANELTAILFSSVQTARTNKR